MYEQNLFVHYTRSMSSKIFKNKSNYLRSFKIRRERIRIFINTYSEIEPRNDY